MRIRTTLGYFSRPRRPLAVLATALALALAAGGTAHAAESSSGSAGDQTTDTADTTDTVGTVVHSPGHSPVPEVEHTAFGTDGTPISYFEYGKPRGTAPTVLLVHGYPNTHAVFYGMVARLAERYHVVAVDTRGSGHSGHPAATSSYTLDLLDGDVAAVIRQSAPGEKVTYVGHDFGGVIGWDLLSRPDTRPLIGRYVTFGAPSFEQWSQWLRTRTSPGDQPFGLLDVAGQMIRIPEFWGFLIPGVPEISWAAGTFDAVVRYFNQVAGEPRESGYPNADGLAQARLYQANFGERILHPRYTRIDSPPPLLSLDAVDDRFFTRDFVRSMDAAQPEVTHVDVPGGHWTPMTHPDAVVDALDHFLATTTEG